MKRLSVLAIVFVSVMVYLLIGCGEIDSLSTTPFGCENPSTDHIEYLGYYSATPLADVSDYSNSIMVGLGRVDEAIELGLEPFLFVGIGFYNWTTNLIDWPKWNALVDAITPYLDDIAGIYIMDEPHLAQWYPPNGLDIEDLIILVDLYKEYFPLTPVWINYSHPHAGKPIPPNLDYISVTPEYDESPGGVYQVFVDQMRAQMHPGQKMFLIGDGYNWDVGRPVPQSWQEFKADTARDYFTIASCDEDIIGIFTFIYTKWPEHTNAMDMPIMQDELREIYEEVFE
jgi:hypothetical protein